MYIPLHTIKFIEKEFEKELSGYFVKTYKINEFEKVLVIEDSLILYIEILQNDMPICENVQEIYKDKINEYFELPQKTHKYYKLHIEELTFNNIDFKYNRNKFVTKIKKITGIDFIWINYFKFVGFYRQIWDCTKGEYLKQKTKADYINNLFPELKLKDRNNQGFTYYIIAIEIEAFDKNKGIGFFYTQEKPHQYIINRCRDWIKFGFTYGNMNMIYNLNGKFPRNKVLSKYPYHTESALETWNGKGYNRQYILENYLQYIYFEKNFSNKADAQVYANKIFENICENSFSNIEKYSYKKPTNKWVSEEFVYKLCKKIFKKHNVIYQHRPFFLKSSIGGQMSYDIFITGLNVAIEYQGKQHFEPVDFFGGEESYKNTVNRDKLKQQLSEQNNVKLVYINYWENITSELIENKIHEVCKKSKENIEI